MSKKNYYPVVNTLGDIDKFPSVEDTWFWFITANQALLDGARIGAGAGKYNRPCLPSDILTIVDRLRRNRRLLRDHIMVMRHYGRRQHAPDRYHPKEMRAASIWQEAMEVLEEVLIAKGIVAKANDWPDLKAYEVEADEYPVFAMTSANDTVFTEFQQ
jgi:hypothetical protein|tara:strand:+ start:190203 stop:190676 length:474 start_codon:yes stop_codon:yes gene_type:complete